MLEEDKAILLSQPFVRFAPFFAAGMLTVYFGGAALGAILFAVTSAALVYLAKVKKKELLCAAGAVLGILLMSAYMKLYCEPVVGYAGETVRTRIYVTEITKRSGQSEELIAKTALDGRTAKLRLSCEEVLPEEHFADVTMDLELAEQTADNLSNGILLSGEITEINSAEYGGADIYGFFQILRGNFSGQLYRNVFGTSKDFSGAILFGEDSKLSPKYTEYLKVSGAAHYTAVSGAHFAVLAAALLNIIPQSRRRTRILMSMMFAPAGLLFYGISPSVLRASVMFFVYSIGLIFHRRSNPLNSLCIAVTVIGLFSPSAVVDAGFGMSVLGVFGVGAVGPAAAEKLREFLPENAKDALSPAVTALCCSICAVICTTPISAALFGSVSLLGAVTSLLIAPFMAIAMACMLLLGITHIPLFAVPIDLAMKATAFLVQGLGKCRALTLSLDFQGAWVLSALLAVLVTVCAFGNLKTFSRFGRMAGVLAIVIITVSVIRVQTRREVRFIGNTYTSSAIVLDKTTADVYISGGGDGLAESISQTLREHGAVRIGKLFAPDLDYGGALAVKELSQMLPIDTVYSNALADGLLTDTEVIRAESGEVFVSCGITIGTGAKYYSPSADILLYGSDIKSISESPAKYAVYFSNAEYELPENFHNARVNRELAVNLR